MEKLEGGIIISIIKLDIEDKRYPKRLLEINNFPIELYVLGNIELLNSEYTVGIVGARKCTDYGRRVSKEFAKEISEKEICVVSGMALGIDSIAHDNALKKDGKTIAVLGSGFNYIYPKENEWLFYKILESGGCVISEYPPNIQADKRNFPLRNRIVSGLSDALLVVEAAYISGSSITAKYARLQGKKLYAIPNNIYANTGMGTNALIQKGAILVTKPEQIIDEIKPTKTKVKASNKNNKNNESNKADNNNKRGNKNNKNDKSRKTNKNNESDESYMLDEKLENLNTEFNIDLNVKTDQKDIINYSTKKASIVKNKNYLMVYKMLSNMPLHINEIAIKLNKPVQEITSTIIMMEIEGYIEQIEPNYYIRKEDKL